MSRPAVIRSGVEPSRERRLPAVLAAPLVLLIPLAACAPGPPVLIDLTYPFDEHTLSWPTSKPFQRQETAYGRTATGYWYAAGDFTGSEHAGTHIDAPIHFAEGRLTVERIPLERLMAPGILIDVEAQCAADPDYAIGVEDLAAWEQRHGPIPPGSIVLFRTGWGRHWPDRRRYLGSPTPEDPRSFHFPGLGVPAARMLVEERHVAGVGIDTASIDPGAALDFPTHQLLNGADVYTLENVAASDRLPPRGFTVVALPVKITRGSGGPVRIVAIVPELVQLRGGSRGSGP